MAPRNYEGAAYQDARYEGGAVYDPRLGIGGPYLYSFVSKLDGGVWHRLRIERQVRTQSVNRGSELVRPEGSIEMVPAVKAQISAVADRLRLKEE